MRKITISLVIILPCLILLSSFFHLGISQPPDTLRAGMVMKDGDFLKSSRDQFRLFFFSIHFSSDRYLGIQYTCYSEKMTIWIANPENPLMDTTGVLKMTEDGNLVITDAKARTNFTINSKQPVKSSNASLTLLDTGNLVLRDGEMKILWQSFDYLSDAFLPNMKLGLFDLKKGQQQRRRQLLTSWVSVQDPAPGAFTLGLDPAIKPQLLIWRRGAVYWRSGTWNGSHSYPPAGLEFYFNYFSNENESHFNFTVNENKLCPWFALDSKGQLKLVLRNGDGTSKWVSFVSCEEGNMTRAEGCVLQPEPLGCRDVGDAFSLATGFMDGWENLDNLSLGLSECREICVRNCSCNAYYTMHSDGTGCRFSYGQKLDHPDWQQDIFYIRNDSLALGSDRNRRVKIIVGTVLPVLFLLCLVLALYVCKKKKRNRQALESQQEDLELPLFDMSTVAKATNGFSVNNKLGEGGFGPVYKGVLDGGQEIAVKRLSQFSKQGADEFMNEVLCIAKLQHRNLVKLLGCCIDEEKMLVYEYMPNKSLDFFIFDETRSMLLNWHKRFQIICGIARGLLYLHQDSRLRIIHRDLKASNILLDYEMNPKISDFGMARIFGENETGASTTRVVGTYGYMSPEYAIDGLFSTKSDVFSFGVLVLEIVSGKKNRGFQHPEHHHTLLGHSWILYKEGRPLELVDASVGDTSDLTEVIRSIHVGLLCVQRDPEERPSMSSVVMMLGSDSTLPQPKEPGFFLERNPFGGDSSIKAETISVNEMSFTLLTAR